MLTRFGRNVAGSALLLVAVALAVWFGGTRFGQSPRLLAIVIGALTLAWLGAVVFAAASRARRRARLSSATRRPAGHPGAGPDSSPASILGQRLARTVQWLRKSKLAESSRDPVYNLPWYLLVGPSGCGKSTVILQSGFTFSYTEPTRPQGRPTIGPTDNWDVWVANEAVFIDPPGKGVLQDRAVEAWRAALDEIRVQRRAKPVDGVVLVVDVADLAALDPNGLRDRAARLRAVVDATIERFEMVLPIYVLLHKCDRLRGFTEYFDSLGGDVDVPLGFMFTREQYTSGQPALHFNAEFDRLADSLVAHRRRAFAGSSETSRGGVYVFPREFALLKGRLGEFIELLFAPNQFRRTPVMRGVYFTSARQGGPSLDVAAIHVSEAAGLPPPLPAEQREGSTSYFIRPLFGRVICPDRALAGLASNVLRRRRLVRAASLVVATALVPLLTLPFVAGAFRDNRAAIEAAKAGGQIATRAGKTSDNVRLLVELKRALEPFECHGETPACQSPGRRFSWGMYAGDAALNAARQAFADGTRTLFVEPFLTSSKALGHTYDGLKTELQAMTVRGQEAVTSARATKQTAAIPAPASAGRPFDGPRAYMLLRTLLMLSLDGRADPEFLASQMQAHWLQGVRGADEALVREIMRFYLHQLGDHHNAAYRVPLAAADKALVADVRTRLLGVPPEVYYYAMIRDEGRQKLNAVRLAAIVGKDNPAQLQSRTEVEGAFTRDGWNAFVKDRIAQMKADYEGERSWVLGLAKQSGQAPIDELLKAQYFADYEQAWWEFVRGVTLPSLGSADAAAARLGVLGDAQASPLIPLLNAVARNTWGDGAKPGVVAAANTKDAAPEIAAKFQSIHDFVRPAEKGDAPIGQYLQAVSRLQVLIRSYLDAKRPKEQEDGIRQEVETGLQATNGLLRSLDPKARGAIEALLKQPFTDVLGIFKSAVPQRHLSVGGSVLEDKKALDGAVVVLLEPYEDNRFDPSKEVKRGQTKAGSFTFSGPVEPGGYKVCVAKKGSQDYYCGPIRISGETPGTSFELKRGKTLGLFGGGALSLVIRVRYLTF